MKFCAPVSVSIVSHPLLDAGQLQVAAAAVHLAVEIHQAADRRAVHVGDRRQVDQDVALARGDQAGDGGREIGEHRIHQPRLADADDARPCRSVRLSHSSVGSRARAIVCRSSRRLSSCPRSLRNLPRQLGPAAVDARLDRALRQPQPVGDLLVRQLLDVAHQHRRAQRRRAAPPAPAAAAPRDRAARAPPPGPGRATPAPARSASTSRSIVSRSLRTLR